MSRLVQFGNAVAREVGPTLSQLAPQSVLLVTGARSFELSKAAAALEGALSVQRLARFSTPEPFPTLSHISQGIGVFREEGCDTIVAVGGGKVMDTAKLIGIFGVQHVGAADIVLRGVPIEDHGPRLIAVPTTAGSGSECTHFAAVYVRGRKYSVAHDSLLPSHAFVDPQLTYSVPPKVTAATGLDALCHAIESFWSVNSTEQSRAYASEAIPLVVRNLPAAVHRPTPEARRAMSLAAHLAGKAINISKTTAAHALSYTMTSHFGVAHGHATALTLGEFLVHNSETTTDTLADSRGLPHLRQAIDDVCELLGCPDAYTARDKLAGLIASLGLADRLTQLGIRTASQRRFLAESANLERLGNNPRTISEEAIRDILERVA